MKMKQSKRGEHKQQQVSISRVTKTDRAIQIRILILKQINAQRAKQKAKQALHYNILSLLCTLCLQLVGDREA